MGSAAPLQTNGSHGGPALLRQLNERGVFEILRSAGPIARTELAQHLGVSMPTVSKAIRKLLAAGLVEEVPSVSSGDDDAEDAAADSAPRRTGRPSVSYRLAGKGVQVVGVAINVRHCRVGAAGLDGTIRPDSVQTIPTPDNFDALIDAIEERARPLVEAAGVKTLVLAVSVPGEVDSEAGRVLMSPNLWFTDNTSPAATLSARLGVEAVLVHETDATCLAEQAFGGARNVNDLVIVGVYEGFGASVISGGRLLRGHRGLAGELGHVTVVPDGRLCGCGNRGCLETEATDQAFARRVSERIGRRMEVEQVVREGAAGKLDVREDLDATLEFLAIGIAAAINIFNPEVVLVCAEMLDCDPGAFGRLEHRARRRSLGPTAQNCRLLRAKGDTLVGAVAAAVHHLTRSLGPRLG